MRTQHFPRLPRLRGELHSWMDFTGTVGRGLYFNIASGSVTAARHVLTTPALGALSSQIQEISILLPHAWWYQLVHNSSDRVQIKNCVRVQVGCSSISQRKCSVDINKIGCSLSCLKKGYRVGWVFF